MFEDRFEAGLLLAEEIVQKEERIDDGIVVGITRGGVIVASVIARIVGLPLRVVVVKKIGAPDQEELAIGAISPKHVIYWDTTLIKQLGLEKSDLARLSEEVQKEFGKREQLLKFSGSLSALKNRTVFLIDDGVATGATVKAALLTIKQCKPKRVILVTPVIAETVYNELTKAFDEIITLSIVEHFHAVGQFYESFPQVSDDEVVTILKERKQ